jgi:hypothetical protein
VVAIIPSLSTSLSNALSSIALYPTSSDCPSHLGQTRGDRKLFRAVLLLLLLARLLPQALVLTLVASLHQVRVSPSARVAMRTVHPLAIRPARPPPPLRRLPLPPPTPLAAIYTRSMSASFLRCAKFEYKRFGLLLEFSRPDGKSTRSPTRTFHETIMFVSPPSFQSVILRLRAKSMEALRTWNTHNESAKSPINSFTCFYKFSRGWCTLCRS